MGKPYRIRALDDDGNVVHRFDSQRAAARAGFTLSRVNIATRTGERHKGLRWRRCDGLHGLAEWLRDHVTDGGTTDATTLHRAFVASLPEVERDIDVRDFWAKANAALPGPEWQFPHLYCTFTETPSGA